MERKLISKQNAALQIAGLFAAFVVICSLLNAIAGGRGLVIGALPLWIAYILSRRIWHRTSPPMQFTYVPRKQLLKVTKADRVVAIGLISAVVFTVLAVGALMYIGSR